MRMVHQGCALTMKPVVAASAFTTYDPAKKGSQITLSNGNLTFVGTLDSAVAVVRGFASGDKKHWENIITPAAALSIRMGVAKSTTNFEGRLGGDISGVGYANSGIVRCGNTIIASFAAYTGNDRLTCEFNADATVANRTLQFFKNGVSVGTVTEALMATAASSFAGTWYAAGGSLSNPSGAVSNFGASAWLDTPTAGFDGIAA